MKRMDLQSNNGSAYKHVRVREKRLDILSVSKLKAELYSIIQAQDNKNIVLDIRNCSFCDAAGLGVIQSIQHMCKEAEGMLIVTGIAANIKKLIKICMLNLEWNIAKDLDEAEDLLKKAGKFLREIRA